MDIYSFFLAMSILKVSDAVFRFQCPVQSHWTHRAGTICGSKSSYFCLYDINENNFTEFCRKNPDFEKPGKKLIVAGSTQGTLQGSNCSNDFYQPLKFWTNESHSCVLAKSYCNEEGQVVYINETNNMNKVDRSCRCDYTRGYDFIIRPKHRCYCVPSEEDCSCHLKICPSNYNFSQDYECLKVTERNTSFYCKSIHSVVCDCNHCTAMPTVDECLCCKEVGPVAEKMEDEDLDCITDHEGFTGNCLNRHVIEVSLYDFVERQGPIDDNEPIHELYRYVAYRRFTRWIWHILGKKEER